MRIDRLNFGPPVGFPVQFRVLGPDADSVRAMADQVRDIMRADPNTRDVQFDWNEQKKSIRLEVDQDRARSLRADAAGDRTDARDAALRLYGVGVSGRHRARAGGRPRQPEERLGLGSFEDLTVLTRSGAAVPLSQVARVPTASRSPSCGGAIGTWR